MPLQDYLQVKDKWFHDKIHRSNTLACVWSLTLIGSMTQLMAPSVFVSFRISHPVTRQSLSTTSFTLPGGKRSVRTRAISGAIRWQWFDPYHTVFKPNNAMVTIHAYSIKRCKIERERLERLLTLLPTKAGTREVAHVVCFVASFLMWDTLPCPLRLVHFLLELGGLFAHQAEELQIIL